MARSALTRLRDDQGEALVQEADGLLVQAESKAGVPEKSDALQQGRLQLEGGPAVLRRERPSPEKQQQQQQVHQQSVLFGVVRRAVCTSGVH